VRVGALLVCLVGCDSLFNLDIIHPVTGDAVDAVRPGDGTVGSECFLDRVPLQAITGSHDPQLSADRRELYVVRRPADNYELYRETRSGLDQLFAVGGAIANVNSNADDTDPAITADGLLLVFKSDRGTSGVPQAYQATRSGLATTFTTPVLVPGLEGEDVYGLDVSPDGLTIYWDDGARLLSAGRADRNSKFNQFQTLTLDRASFPSVSGDGLELYYNAAGVVRRTRADTSQPFTQQPVQIDAGGADADLVADGSALVLTGGPSSDMVYLRERCP
jgi:hypothetical protein